MILLHSQRKFLKWIQLDDRDISITFDTSDGGTTTLGNAYMEICITDTLESGCYDKSNSATLNKLSIKYKTEYERHLKVLNMMQKM